MTKKMTPEEARRFLERLDLIDETHPSAGDSFILKGVLRDIIRLLVTAPRSSNIPNVQP